MRSGFARRRTGGYSRDRVAFVLKNVSRGICDGPRPLRTRGAWRFYNFRVCLSSPAYQSRSLDMSKHLAPQGGVVRCRSTSFVLAP